MAAQVHKKGNKEGGKAYKLKRKRDNTWIVDPTGEDIKAPVKKRVRCCV